jgi:hypothetical protein
MISLIHCPVSRWVVINWTIQRHSESGSRFRVEYSRLVRVLGERAANLSRGQGDRASPNSSNSESREWRLTTEPQKLMFGALIHLH